MIDWIPVIISPELLAIVAAAGLIIWAAVFRKRRRNVLGCITQWDALIVFLAVFVSGAFEVLILLTDDYQLAVALSRVMRLWGYAAWLYIGWRQLDAS